MRGRKPFFASAQLHSFRRSLLRWYDQNHRELPWRRDRDPYRVWVSEIMLQQTRVAAVLDHYARFLRRFPTVQSLARAREATVLAAWSGLGYYHRARRMHQAARVIVREWGGSFPRTAEEWSKLPGIGRYTANAIASIAFGEAVAVVDGNVERVLRRLFGSERRKLNAAVCRASAESYEAARAPERPAEPAAQRRDGFSPGCKPQVRGIRQSELRSSGTSAKNDYRKAAWQEAQVLLDRRRPGDFNQAMMELGATVCTPRAPQCLICPLRARCPSRGAEASRWQVARNHRQLSYALVQKGFAVLLVRRPAESPLMAGMWELPELDITGVNGAGPLMQLRHSITDTDYRVAVFAVPANRIQPRENEIRWVTRRQWERLPLTGLARKILQRLPAAPCDGEGESKCH